MTYAIFSIVANEVSPSGCSAYTYAQYSYSPYVRGPFFQFSEQVVDDWALNDGTHPAFPFLTGSGGANQVALFGYLGYRMLPDFVLHLNPNLPPQIPHISYRTFYWRGWPLKAASNYTHTTIQQAKDTPPLDTADREFADKSIPVQVGPESNSTSYTLPPTGPLVIPNRQVGDKVTYPGNLVQCRPVTSPNPFVEGQFPISAVDGAASTKWQPRRANETAVLTVSFPDTALSSSSSSSSSSMISGFGFDWAQAPPKSARVLLHDKPLSAPGDLDISSGTVPPGTVVAADLPSITLSDPYDPETTDLNVITQQKGNTTNMTLADAVPVTRYATLLITGNQGLGPAEVAAGNGTGASVAEWSILGPELGQGSGKCKDGEEDEKSQEPKRLKLRGTTWREDL